MWEVACWSRKKRIEYSNIFIREIDWWYVCEWLNASATHVQNAERRCCCCCWFENRRKFYFFFPHTLLFSFEFETHTENERLNGKSPSSLLSFLCADLASSFLICYPFHLVLIASKLASESKSEIIILKWLPSHRTVCWRRESLVLSGYQIARPPIQILYACVLS